MNRIPKAILCLLLLFHAGIAFGGTGAARVFDLAAGTETTLDKALAPKKGGGLVLVGEHHTDVRHHRGQLRVIQALHEAGIPLAVGMEMFRSDVQPQLDAWSAGSLGADDFERLYDDNWNYPYAVYAPIFAYLRENRIPLVGLNISREITRQVAREGFDSLTDAQKGELRNVVCRVDEAYMTFIREAFGVHAHGKMDFTHFCEAQLVWDNIMAINALNHLSSRPGTVMVILTGSGHARKMGIPAQVRKRSDIPVTVILPEEEGVEPPGSLTPADADYILLHLDSPGGGA